MRPTLKNKKRIVIKIGSSILSKEGTGLHPARFKSLVAQVAQLMERKVKVILVSSGAIAAGMHRLGLARQPVVIPQKQAIAAAGQTALMHEYEKAFAKHGLFAAQILLTRDDLTNRRRFLNARHAITELLRWNIVPIINENDTVAVHEIKVGDNDNLSALVTNLVESDLLMILTDIDGVYDVDPRVDSRAQRIRLIENIDDKMKKAGGDTLRAGSTGGMRTKLEAGEKAAHYGVATLILDGKEPKVIARALAGEDLGTLILPRIENRLSARKHWLAYTLQAAGSLVVDAGAREALCLKGKSLLPSGIRDCEGHFSVGDPVDLSLEGEKPFARGLTGYSSEELRKIMGHKSGEIEKILGYKYFDEVVHRDDLVIL
jgi:glutamate 5-kinase